MTATLIVLISIAAAFCWGKKSFLAANSYSLVASVCYLVPFSYLYEHYFLAQSCVDLFIVVLMYLIYSHNKSTLCKHIIYFSLASITLNFIGWSVYNHYNDVAIYNTSYLAIYAGVLISIIVSRKNGDRRNKHRRILYNHISDTDYYSEIGRWTKNYKR